MGDLKFKLVDTEHILLGFLRECHKTSHLIVYSTGGDFSLVHDMILDILNYFINIEEYFINLNNLSICEYGSNLTLSAHKGLLDPVIGRETEIARIVHILGRRAKNNPCLIGQPGVGTRASEGAMDTSNLIKPALARGFMRCIGATTESE